MFSYRSTTYFANSYNVKKSPAFRLALKYSLYQAYCLLLELIRARNRESESYSRQDIVDDIKPIVA